MTSINVGKDGSLVATGSLCFGPLVLGDNGDSNVFVCVISSSEIAQ